MADDDDATKSLDVPERQVLIYDETDANPWQHRLLLRRLEAGKAKWIVATPDHDVECVHLSSVTVRDLARNVDLPEDAVDKGCCAFGPISCPDMLRLKGECNALADVLGAVAVVPTGAEGRGTAVWFVSDPGSELFNKEVPTAVSGNSLTFIFRSHDGLCCIEQGWITCENVEPDDRAEGLDSKRAGAGRDPRLIMVKRARGVGMQTTRRDASPTYTKGAREGWPFKGPDATAEFLGGILATGLEPAGFVAQWRQSSGVSPHSGVAIEFSAHLTTLAHMVSFDQ